MLHNVFVARVDANTKRSYVRYVIVTLAENDFV